MQGFACRENGTGRVRPDQGSGLGQARPSSDRRRRRNFRGERLQRGVHRLLRLPERRGCSGSFLVASITYLLRAFGRLDPRRFGKCSGGVLVFSVDDRGEAAAVASSFPPSTRKEKLQREFPRREHYLLRAFEWLKGWTLADSEAAAGVSSLRGRSDGETVVRFGLRGNGTERGRLAQRRSPTGIS